MQQEQLRRPPPPKALAITVLLVGIVALGLAGRVVWGWIAPDAATAGHARLVDAEAALADNKPNRAVRLATEAGSLFDEALDNSGMLQASALETRALHAAGRSPEAAKALTRTLELARQFGSDPQASQTLAELFFSIKRYDLAANSAAEAGQGILAAGNHRAAAQQLTAFAGRLAVAGQPALAVRLYADAIGIFMQINLRFQAAQLYERIGITLAPTDAEGAYAAYIEAINRFALMGEQKHADAVIQRVQQLPQSFLETIDE